MNIANVTSKFALMTGLDNAGIYKWNPMISDACQYIQSRLKKTDLGENDLRRAETLCALYAFRLYAMCNGDEITSFVAGDVHITSPNTEVQRADRAWKEYASTCADLIDGDSFLFGRVII